jgi:hypothetical protein
LHVWFCEFISILNPFHHGNYTCLQCAMIRKFIGWGTLTPWKSTWIKIERLWNRSTSDLINDDLSPKSAQIG